MIKKTKIIATLGPASGTPEMIRKLIAEGANVFRINCSHAKPEAIRRLTRSVRSISAEMDRPIAVMLDLQGPKIRVGEFLDSKMELKAGALVTLKVTRDRSDGSFIPVRYEDFAKDVRPGNTVLLDDGKLALKIVSKNGVIKARVLNSGTLSSKKGINLPDSSISASPITAKDLRDLRIGLAEGVDYVALSFVREAMDIVRLKKLVKRRSPATEVVAKIERHEAIANLEGILEVTDAAMVARGDLGVEIPLCRIPVTQARIIRRCFEMAKPVIVATQMMESMMASPRPARSDISDVSGAVQSYADALMLSGETSTGKYPVECVREMKMAAMEMEAYQMGRLGMRYWELRKEEFPDLADSVGKAGVSLAELLNATCIVVVTNSGYMAKKIASLHPLLPIYAFTRHDTTMRKLAMVRGVWPFCSNLHKEFGKNLPHIFAELKGRKLIRRGDRIVIVAGVVTSGRGGTNTVRAETVP